MGKINSVNLDITNNPDGFDISGGSTSRKLTVTGGDVTLAGSGAATITFPTTSTTLAGTSIINNFTAVQSFPNGISGIGATFGGDVSITNLKMLAVGGDEGGQIDFQVPITNTSLTGNVVIDIYQNRLRIFESTGTNRGAYIDITAAGAGVGSNLLSGGSTPPLATASITGVASFNVNDFGVAATGHVSLTGNVARTNITNNFTAVQAFPNGISGQSIRIGSGATFGSTINLTSNTAQIDGYNTAGYLKLESFGTLFTTQAEPSIILQDADTDLGGEPSITINPHQVGGGTVTIGNTTLSTINLQGNTVNSGRMSVVRGLSAQSLLVAAGATFSSRASFVVGLTTQSLNVAQGATFNARASFAVGLSTGNLTVTRGATFTDIVNSTTLRNYGEVFSYQIRKELNLAKTATHYYTDLRYGNTFFLSLVGSDNAGTFGGYAGGAAKPSIQVPFDGACLLATTIGVTGATATALTGSLTAGQFIFSPGLTDSGVTAFNIHGASTVVLSKPATFTTNEFAIFINPPSEGLGMVASPHNLVASSKSPARVHSFTVLVNCTAGSSITWNSGLTSYGQIKWPSGTPPTITTTNGKMDVFSFLSYDHGVSWLAFNAGQNF